MTREEEFRAIWRGVADPDNNITSPANKVEYARKLGITALNGCPACNDALERSNITDWCQVKRFIQQVCKFCPIDWKTTKQAETGCTTPCEKGIYGIWAFIMDESQHDERLELARQISELEWNLIIIELTIDHDLHKNRK